MNHLSVIEINLFIVFLFKVLRKVKKLIDRFTFLNKIFLNQKKKTIFGNHF